MADVHQLQSDAERRNEAGAWIACLDSESVSAEDRARFEEWRRAHPRNARIYNELFKTWGRMNDMGRVVRDFEMGQTLSAVTQRAIRQSRAARNRGRRIVFAAAASLAVMLCLGWWVNSRTPGTQFQTGIGEHATVKLPDGSTLELNSNSLARVAYSGHARVIRLERGEAYFEVEHDTQRPFWVAAGESWVGAVGTAFNVDMRAAGVRVIVSEGAVKVAASVSSPAPPVADREKISVSLVKAGQQLNVRGGTTEVRSLATAQLTRSLSWREGYVDFKDDRLADVVEELNRYTPLRIVIEDDALRELGIGGTFETNAHGAEALLTILKTGFGLNVRRDDLTVYISER